MRIGFHVSIAGGIPLSVGRAAELGCTTMQLFTHSPRSWALTDISREDAALFASNRINAGIAPVFVHTSYLINLASSKPELYGRSIDALRTEVLRADMIGAEYVVTHLGSASESGPAEALGRVSVAVARALDGLDTGTVLLLENTAGERGDVGWEFGDIGEIISRSGAQRIGVAMDTCHSFGAGYDLKTKSGLDDVVDQMDAAFGLHRLKLVHLNDSKHPLGSRRDRHESIGQGEIGRAAFRRILNHPRLRDIPFVMETPKAAPDDDIKNMALVREIRNKI